MTNGEKYKTASERKIAYNQYCKDCAENEEAVFDTFDWLDAEYIPPPETIPEIIAEIRKKHPAEEYPAEYGGGEVPNKMRLLADRIEAAWNRREICDRMNREAAIGKEEDAKYEYEIQGKYEGKWLAEAKNFSSINEAKVNRPAEWEVVE